MARQPKSDQVVTLEKALTLFETWRRQPCSPRRIPDELWGAAVSLCGHHSVHRVSRALRLNYTDLKERFEQWDGASSQGPFVELGNGTLAMAQAEMFVECDDGARHQMRVHCRGPVDSAVVDLVKSFFGTTGR